MSSSYVRQYLWWHIKYFVRCDFNQILSQIHFIVHVFNQLPKKKKMQWKQVAEQMQKSNIKYVKYSYQRLNLIQLG